MKDTLTKKYGVDVRTNVENRRITESWDAMQRQVGPGPLTVAVSKQPHLCTVVVRPLQCCWQYPHSYSETFHSVAVSSYSPRVAVSYTHLTLPTIR